MKISLQYITTDRLILLLLVMTHLQEPSMLILGCDHDLIRYYDRWFGLMLLRSLSETNDTDLDSATSLSMMQMVIR